MDGQEIAAGNGWDQTQLTLTRLTSVDYVDDDAAIPKSAQNALCWEGTALRNLADETKQNWLIVVDSVVSAEEDKTWQQWAQCQRRSSKSSQKAILWQGNILQWKVAYQGKLTEKSIHLPKKLGPVHLLENYVIVINV